MGSSFPRPFSVSGVAMRCSQIRAEMQYYLCRLCVRGKLLHAVGVGWGGMERNECVRGWRGEGEELTKEPARKRRRRSHAEGCRFYFFRGAIFVFFSVDLGSGLGMGPAGNIFPNVAQPASLLLNQTNRIQCQCAKEQACRGEGGERKSQNLCSGINKWDAFLGIDLFGPNPQQTHHHRETLHWLRMDGSIRRGIVIIDQVRTAPGIEN